MAVPLINMTFKPTLAQVRTRFTAMHKDLRDRRDPNARVRVFLDGWVQRNFRTEGGKVGGWKPLAAGGRWKTYKDGRRVLDPSAKILSDTGMLKHSFLTFEWNNGNIVGIGSDVPYSEKHEYGEGNVPQRRMLPRRSEIIEDVRRIFDQFVGKIIKRKGLY